MALCDRLRKGAAKYLEPEEQVHAAFLATRPSVKSHHYAVAATDRRILLLALDWTGLRTTRLVGEVPRNARPGSARAVASCTPCLFSE